MKSNLEDFENIFQHKSFEKIASKYIELQDEYNNLGFNFFEIISDKFYYENFHSDIISALLNYKKEFIDSFITTLNNANKSKTISIDSKNYTKYKTVREEKRIDIFIKDINSKHCIIIENKINNAIDRKKQLYNYLKKAETEGYEVDAIIYLTLDGTKEPDFSTYKKDEKNRVNEKLIKFSAISDDNTSIILWIDEIRSENYKKDDIYCFLQQYIKLLKHLKNEFMDYKNMDIFYEQVVKGNFDKAIAFYEMFYKIDEYLIKRIKKTIISNVKNSFFKEPYLYDGNEQEKEPFYSLIFQGNKENEDIYFEITRYWENDFKNKFIVGFFSLEDEQHTKKVLDKYKLTEFFESTKNIKEKYHNRYFETFEINKEEKLLEFVKMILNKLSSKK